MSVKIKSSDLKYIYSKKAQAGDNPKLIKLDSKLFDRDVEYEVIPMLENVMNAFKSKQQSVLHLLEDLLKKLPSHLRSRTQVFSWLIHAAGLALKARGWTVA